MVISWRWRFSLKPSAVQFSRTTRIKPAEFLSATIQVVIKSQTRNILIHCPLNPANSVLPEFECNKMSGTFHKVIRGMFNNDRIIEQVFIIFRRMSNDLPGSISALPYANAALRLRSTPVS